MHAEQIISQKLYRTSGEHFAAAIDQTLTDVQIPESDGRILGTF
jgi:hypothetical protein